MLAETGSTIHYVRTENLELKVETYKFASIEYRINLKTPQGKAQVVELIKKMDVFLESFRPGVMERLGLSPKEVHQINLKIIYVRLSGYGQSDKSAGHDSNYLAKSGIISKFVFSKDGKPGIPGNIVADYCNGSLATFLQILTAKNSPKKSNIVIDSSMTFNTSYYSQPELLRKDDDCCVPYEGKVFELENINFKL